MMPSSIAEMQADTIIRRYPSMRIASLRLHWSIPHSSVALQLDPGKRAKDLWGYVQQDSGAEAFLLAVELDDVSAAWSGHEAFFITAPETVSDTDSKVLHETYWPDVPLKDGKEVSGKTGFFDCSKAERVLGWKHKDESAE